MAGCGLEGDTYMSYILDALKKLEHEKTRKNRGSGVINITGELFEHEQPQPVRRSAWKIAVVITAAIVITFTLTWKFLSSGPKSQRYELRQTENVPKAPLPLPNPVPPALPPAPTPAPLPVQATSPVLAAKPVTNPVTRPLPAPIAALPVKQLAPAPLATTVEEDAASILTQQELRRRMKERKTAPVLPVMAPPADIKLSGIAFQDERRARRAVVNGFLMQEGSVVSGATITDIYQDRVRFLLAGRTFELSLVSAGAAPAGR